MERVRVDVAARGVYRALHRTQVDEVIRDLRENHVSAVVVSASRYDPVTTAQLAAVVREFPRIPTFALLTDVQKSTPQAVHALGQIGVGSLIDARQASGWAMLRDRLSREHSDDIQRATLLQLADDVSGISADCWRFFEVLFTSRPHISNIRHLGRCLYVHPTTLMSRFYRAKLPSPKRYIDAGRLIEAACLLENQGFSLAAMVRQLDYSSTQAFGRHVRSVCGVSTSQFRRQFTGRKMLDWFRETLILPYENKLRGFHPVAVSPGWIATTIGQRDTKPTSITVPS